MEKLNGIGKTIRLLVALNLGFGRGKRLLSWLWLRCVGKNSVIIEYYGVMFELHPFGNTVENKMLFSSKQREKTELSFLAAHLTEDGYFLDIGANIGLYSMFVAAYGATHVIAVEPQPIVVSRFKRNVELNGFQDRVQVVE